MTPFFYMAAVDERKRNAEDTESKKARSFHQTQAFRIRRK
jgi:hypothetical protein